MTMEVQPRDLARSKALRDDIAKHGFANVVQKRIIIAPSMEGMKAKDVTVHAKESIHPSEIDQRDLALLSPSLLSSRRGKLTDKNGQEIDVHALNERFCDYKDWLLQRKSIRQDLNNASNLENWLQRKEDLSELESRVLLHFLPPIQSVASVPVESVESSIVVPTPTPPPLSKAQARLLPLLQQPLPLALATIDLYCQSNRIRLVDLFSQIDKDKNWSLTRDEIREIVKETAIPFTDAQIDELIIALDLDNDNELAYQELALGLEAYKIDTRWQKIKGILSEAKEEHQDDIINQTYTTIPLRRGSSTWLRRLSDASLSPSVHFGDSNTTLTTHGDSLSTVVPSGSLLQIPSLDTREKVEDSAEKVKEKRLRKQQMKKEKRAKQKKKIEKLVLPLSSMPDQTGKIKNKYYETQYDQMNTALDISHTQGVPIKKEILERVFLFPADKSKSTIFKKIRQPGLDLISSFDDELYRECLSSRGIEVSNSGTDITSNKERRRRKKKRTTPNTIVDVYWPQSMLDKLRLCDDTTKPVDKSSSIFYTVK